MIGVSGEYKQYIADIVDSTLPRDFTAKAIITLADSTVLNIAESDIVVGGLKIDDATSTSNSFQIGSAIINQCTLMLNNVEGKFNDYDFTDAVISLYIGLELSETTEWLLKGIFTVDESTVASSIISLIALDNMNKFDTPFSDVTTVFPCTALQLLQAVCTHCGVSLASSTFTNDNFSIPRRPSDEATTCREIVSWIAQLSGNFARINVNGALELKWYDMSTFEQADNLDGGIFDEDTPYSSGDSADGGDFSYSEEVDFDGGTFEQSEKYHHIYALNQATIATDDVVITGLQVKAQGTELDYGETVLFGSAGYVIEITNPLITENTASIIANSVGAKIVGMKFRPLNISVLSDPSIEAGDVAYVTDRKSNTYQILITNSSYTIGNTQNISCDAETPSKKQSVRFDALTKTIVEARNAAKQELTAYDVVMQQFNNLISHSFGVYKSEETLEDGSTIYYMHDKPTLAESQNIWKQTANTFSVSNDGGDTYVAGFDASGNAVFNILNTIGINAEWINAGDIYGVNIVGSTVNGGVVAGFTTTPGGLSKTSSYTFGPFTQADRDRVQQILLNNITPIQTDYDRFDINRNGIIDLRDMLTMNQMRTGAWSYTYNYNVTVNSEDPDAIIETVATDSISGVIRGRNKIGASSITTNYLVAQEATVTGAATGTFTTVDGKTVDVTGGIITAIY